ncbi:bile acid:sodium symporter [Tamilnaduibacter salinus]|uniref:Bile acid:sodium symporter n=1 Tax=Tamilnaduibacter salinus TaxID=1484056 RepID=A0A2A2I0F0_9GAMM|nr:bile acid:sodium symporter [Tamilnaduibacter salinus]PAV25189.1 bile acid:sodium symporter [Tamilnaduibacter salinus]
MESSPLIDIGLPISLFIIMVGIGMTLTVRDFRQLAIYPRGIIVGSIAQIVGMPLLAVLIIALMGPTPAIAVGLVIIAACPGGTTSNLFVMLSKGNVALSIVLTVIASLVTILSLPLFTNMALQHYMDESASIALPVGRTIAMLVVLVLIPVTLGMIFRSFKAEAAQKAEGVVSIFGGVVLAAIVVGLVVSQWDRLFSLLGSAGPSTAFLNLGGIAMGLAVSRFSGLSPRESLAVAVELGIKNGTIGLMVTLTLLKSSEMSIPSAIYGVLMFLFGFVLVIIGRRILPDTTPRPTPDTTNAEPGH